MRTDYPTQHHARNARNERTEHPRDARRSEIRGQQGRPGQLTPAKDPIARPLPPEVAIGDASRVVVPGARATRAAEAGIDPGKKPSLIEEDENELAPKHQRPAEQKPRQKTEHRRDQGNLPSSGPDRDLPVHQRNCGEDESHDRSGEHQQIARDDAAASPGTGETVSHHVAPGRQSRASVPLSASVSGAGVTRNCAPRDRATPQRVSKCPTGDCRASDEGDPGAERTSPPTGCTGSTVG